MRSTTHPTHPRASSGVVARLVCLSFATAASFAAPSVAQQTLAFPAIEGWWRSELAHNGQTSEMFLHFVTDGGKPSVRLSAPDLGAWDFPFGEVRIEGNELTMPSAGLSLSHDATTGTLKGVTPDSLVPVYRIPVEFKRIAPPPAPREPQWKHPRPAIAWRFNAGAPVWAGIGYDAGEGLLFIGTDSGALQALDSRNGDLLWVVDTLGSIRAQPTAYEDAVYVASDDGFLYKFDVRRGTERWRVRIDSSPEPRKARGSREARFDRYGSAAAVDRKHVYIGSRDGNLYALDRATGKEAWRATAKDMITATPLLSAGQVIFGSYDRNVYAVSAADGKALWQRDARGAVATDLALDGSRLLVGTRAYDLKALDAGDGAPLWNYYYWFSWVDSGPTVQDGIAYVGSSDAASVFALDMKTGELKWRKRLNGWCWPKTAVFGRRVYAAMVGGDAGFTTRRGAFVALNRRNGDIEWAHVSDQPDPLKQFGFAASPVATKDRVYAADLEGFVYAFQARLSPDARAPAPSIGMRAVSPPPRPKR